MLTLSKRDTSSKSQLTKIRRAGDIPAVIYSSRQENISVTVKGDEYSAILRGVKEGYLPVTVFHLNIEGKELKAIVKGIEYHRTTYNVQHLDFQILEEDVPLLVKVPVDFTGEMDCVGIKLGGFLRKVMRHVRVRCLPKDIPTDFPVAIGHLNIGATTKVADIKSGSNVKLLVKKEDVLAVIAKR
ncbi:50S ribosomal protein L25 [Candidatus Aerophobetes bacterium]|uniref:Large ribosomal subunit protein bL25 n=1 Tax=Aerophobetes bacterium TaxID=2030807 RepID=A0A2A4X7D4_UNCAE|nr:MAG: 50S ribosomal protein L25 [Candidatus Aerophobetes bacterium]